MQRTMNDGCEQTFLFDSDESHEPHDERDCTTKLINDLRSTIDKYSHRLSALQLENESLLHQLTTFEEQNGEYILRSQTYERDLCALKQQLKRDAEEKEETISELEQSLKYCEESKRCVDQQLCDLKDENAALLFEIEKFKDKYSDCEQTVKEVEGREVKLLQQLNETEYLLNNEIEQNARLSTALEETGDIVKQKNEELQIMANKLDDMKREMTEKDIEMTAMEQVLQLVDVTEEVDEDSNSTVETDEAVDCNVYTDEFSSLESNRSSSDTCFVPRTSTAIDVLKQRRRRRRVIVKRKKQKSFWDELQLSSDMEVSYNYVENVSIGTQTEEDMSCCERSMQRSQSPSLTLPTIIAMLLLLFGRLLDNTNIPSFWSWEDIFRKISERIVSKEKVSKCQ